MVFNSKVNAKFSLERKHWMRSGISEGVCADVHSICDNICERVFFCLFFFEHGASGTQICSSSSDSWSNLPETSSLHHFLLI